jgi:hypothetical protein
MRHEERPMTSNIASRRFKKAVRRKAQVAEKRRLEKVEGTLPAQVRRALAAPIRHCLLQDSLFEEGIGALVVTRGASTNQLELGTFLLDAYCLGIKDVMYRSIEAEEFAYYLDISAAGSPLRPVDPAYARKLLRDLAAWAKTIGFAPHPDFSAVELMLGDVNAEASDATFRFGRDGRPCYMPGPSESPSLIRSRLGQLQQRFGAEGFDFLAA